MAALSRHAAACQVSTPSRTPQALSRGNAASGHAPWAASESSVSSVGSGLCGAPAALHVCVALGMGTTPRLTTRSDATWRNGFPTAFAAAPAAIAAGSMPLELRVVPYFNGRARRIASLSSARSCSWEGRNCALAPSIAGWP